MALVRNTKCCVPECRVPQSDLLGLKTHRLPNPKEKARREKWLRFCLFDTDPGGSLTICGAHFPAEAYQMQYRLMGRERKDWRLNEDAVPTLFPPPGYLPDDFLEIIEEIDPADDPIIEEREEEETIGDVISYHQCRLCLDMVDPEDSTVNLFDDTPDGGESLSRELLVLFQLIIEPSPLWPTIACKSCVKFMHQIKEFKETIMASHRKLYKEIAEGKYIEETTIAAQQEDLPEAMQSMLNNVDSGDTNESERMEEEDDSDAVTDDEGETATGEVYLKYLDKRSVPPRDLEREKVLEKQMIELKWLVCGECSQDDFETLQDLSDHMHSDHELAKSYIICCQAKFGIRKGAYDHMEYHLDPDKFKCLSCDNRFMSGGLLKFHNCPKSFASSGNFKRHVERMHEIEDRCVCEICGKKFSNLETYYDHVENHRNPNKYRNKGSECPVCGRRYVALQEHLAKVHDSRTEATPNEQELIECVYCSEVVQRVRMTGHYRMRHNKSFMECRPCNKQFKSPSQFQDHKARHMKVVFKCDFCEKTNNTGQGKSLHMKSHHPEEYKLKLQTSRKTSGTPSQ